MSGTRTSVPQTHAPGTGWRDWCSSIYDPDWGVYRHRMVEAWRVGWQDVEVLRLDNLHPAFNVAGLWWRPLSAPKLEPEVKGRRG
jgi:hypothetical protein